MANDDRDVSHVLYKFPSRAVVDSNVLLDAALVADGFGARALFYLAAEKIALYVDEIAYRDAVRVLSRHRQRCSFPTIDLEGLLVQCCNRFRIMSAPPGAEVSATAVKRQDRHLNRLAKELQAFVVTDDAPLVYQLSQSHVPTRMTRELAAFGTGEPPPTIYLISGKHLGPATSFFFVRCEADKTLLDPSRTEATLCESKTMGRFFYDTKRKALCFEADWLDRISCDFEVVPEQEFITALNFDFRKGTRIGVRAAYAGPIADGKRVSGHDISIQSPRRPPADFGQGAIRLMNSYELGNGWPGIFQCCTWGPGKLRGDAWRTYSNVPWSAPNPLTSDVVATAVALLQQDGNFVRLPTLIEVAQQVANA